MKNIWKEGKWTTIIGGVLVTLTTTGVLAPFPVLNSIANILGGALIASKDPKPGSDKYQPEI